MAKIAHSTLVIFGVSVPKFTKFCTM